ncbi:MAG: ABC transporter substrate-binding protein [bacterium]|nr:ABC transporter substrate-binding protein [bacterium]
MIKRKPIIRLILPAILAVLTTLAVAAPSSGMQETGTGNAALKKPPQRIISLAPSLTESIYLLGAESFLKGCTTYCNIPEAAKLKRKVGTLMELNLEQILVIKPDLVIAMEFSDRKAIRKLKLLGIPVEIFKSPKNFHHLCESFLRLGNLVAREMRAKKIVSAARESVASIRQLIGKEKEMRIFWQLGAKPLYAATKHFFTNDYILFAGGVNILGDAASGTFSREEVLKRNPEAIIIVTMGIVGESEKHNWEAFKSIDAVKHNRIFILDSNLYCSPTPQSFARGLKELVALIRPAVSLPGAKLL